MVEEIHVDGESQGVNVVPCQYAICTCMTRFFKVGLISFVLWGISASAEDSFQITASSISGGGIIESESSNGDWELAGTIGQWEATRGRFHSAPPFQSTGGFWALSLPDLPDSLFMDRFEAQNVGQHPDQSTD